VRKREEQELQVRRVGRRSRAVEGERRKKKKKKKKRTYTGGNR
jgi:hypothetical protein